VQVAVKALGVVPVHPSQRGQFDVLDRLPGAGAGGAADQLGLVVAVDGLGQRVDAPIFVNWSFVVDVAFEIPGCEARLRTAWREALGRR
jgi:hypothetical protein